MAQRTTHLLAGVAALWNGRGGGIPHTAAAADSSEKEGRSREREGEGADQEGEGEGWGAAESLRETSPQHWKHNKLHYIRGRPPLSKQTQRVMFSNEAKHRENPSIRDLKNKNKNNSSEDITKEIHSTKT